MSSPCKLNIGAGKTYLPGFVNVDRVPWADVSIDLETNPLPFGDESVDLVFSASTLEHLDNYLGVLSEIHRVLVPGGWLLLSVPYVTLTEYNLVNPYHRQLGFSEYSFDFFDPAKLQGSAVEDKDITLIKAFHRLHYMPEFQDAPEDRKEWSRRHLLNVVGSIDFGLVKGRQPGAGEADKMRTCFDECMGSRTRYSRKKEGNP